MAQLLSFINNTPGSQYSITSGSAPGLGDAGTIGSSGSIVTGVEYVPGTYNILWNYVPPTGSAVTRTDTFTVVAGQWVYNFAPLQASDPGTTGGALATSTVTGAPAAPTSSNPSGPAASATPSAVAIQAPNSSPDYPFTWPAYGYGKYFTPTQASLYIGNLFIDELTGFQYVLQSNRVPIYGYSSNLMDAVGTGKSLVQGQFSINFISEGYLYTVLDQYTKRASDPQNDAEAAAVNLTQTYTSLQGSPNAALPSAQAQMATVKQQLLYLLKNNPNLPSILASAQSAGNVPFVGYNPVYRRPPFDIVLRFDGADRTVVKRIMGCVLTSNEQVLGDNDMPVAESYGFIARLTK